MDETIEGKVFIGCLECGEEWPEPTEERHKMTCSKVDEIMAEMDEENAVD